MSNAVRILSPVRRTRPGLFRQFRPLHRRLFGKYVLLLVGLVGLVLLVNAGLHFWFSYNENETAAFRIQQEKARAAAQRIEEFIEEIERQLGWTTAPQWSAGPLDQRRFDFVRLLRQVPAITELIQLDDAGKEQLKVSRLAIDVVGSEKDYSGQPGFIEARKKRIWLGPVYFRKESEPYMTLAMAQAGRNAGVTIAEVNLKLIWDVITGLKIGEHGYAYVVDRDGRLIAHPDISLVLRNIDLSHMPQVTAARAEISGGAGAIPAAMIAEGMHGHSMLSAHAAIAPLGWTVFVELPMKEALAPLYNALYRSAALLLLGLALATSAALFLARRMVGPIRLLQAGAARIGAGELDRRIDIHTGDELEDLAGDFNRMASDLQKSYAELEKKVEERTAELKEALDQQTATAEVLGVINSSPGDLAPVFEAILEKTLTLCAASFGDLSTYAGEQFLAVATRGFPPALIDFYRNPFTPDPKSYFGQLIKGEDVLHIADMAAEFSSAPGTPLSRAGVERGRALVELGNARTGLFLALRKDDALLGAMRIFRQEVRPFSDKQIALLQNFAAQAVIAMENARLITETREALEQQTATAEVLQVINSSPGDLAPVFDAMLEKAHALCGADHGHLTAYEGGQFRALATHGVSEEFEKLLRQPFRPGLDVARRLRAGESVIQFTDMAALSFDPDDRIGRGAAELAGARTLLIVALRKDDALLGYITAHRTEVRPFSAKEIALLQNFAAQAVIAMENARLITETREALAQQTATAEVLQVINSSPGDLALVFDAMLDKAMRLCEAAFGGLWTFDQDRYVAVAMKNVPAACAEFFANTTAIPGPGTAPYRFLHGERLAHEVDLASTEPYKAGDPMRRALVDLGGARTALQIPLCKDDHVLGVITIYRKEIRPFTDKQIALLQNFAAQAVIAMENARLLTETREALEQQTATAEVLQVINSSPGDLRPVFDAMLEKALTLCEAACGQLATYDGEAFEFVALKGDAHWLEERPRGRLPASRGLTWSRLLAGEPYVHILDALDTDAYRSGHEGARDAVIAGGRTFLTVALRRDQALLGALTVYRQEVRPFTEKQIALLQNFAAQAVIAMENARLITELRQRTHDLQEALEYQTATSDVLKVISRSAFELEPVLKTVVETAARLCLAEKAIIYRYEDGAYRYAVGYGNDPRYEQIERETPIYPGEGTVVGRMALEGRTVQIVDAWADPLYEFKDEARSGNVRTMIGVPLIRDGMMVGAIALARATVEPFTEKQIELVTVFADQAVIAIENARLITDLRQRTRDLQESLEYQTATSDVLKVISRQTFDLQPVLQTVAETAARLCESDMAFILRRDGEVYRAAAALGWSPEYSAFLEQHPIVPNRGTLTGRVALERRAIQIADITADPEYTLTEATTLGKARTQLGVPLLREEEPIGVIILSRQSVRPFTEKQVELVTTFADQAVIAIENARLLNELRARTAELGRSVEELRLLSEVGQAVSSTLDVRAVLSTILTRSVGLASADAGAIFRYVRTERAFRLVDAVGWDEALSRAVRDQRIAEAETAMGEAAARRAPMQIADLAKRPRAPLRDASLGVGFRSVLIVPLVGPERILGALVLQRRAVGEFPPETVRLMQTLASQSVLAIQNARLFREIADKSEQLALASQHKSQFLANMSHELRTPLNAILGYAELLVDGIYGQLPDRPKGVLERIQNNGKHLLALINDVLDLAKIEAGQLTLTLEDYSLPEVVQSVVTATEPLATSKGLKFAAAVQDGLPMAHGDARRVSQVLLNLVGNAIKFTDAGEVEIRAGLDKGQFVLTVRDTGPGIADADQERIFGEFQQIDNTNTRKKGGTGLGLAISKRMVEMQGGTISVDSVVGQGSTFRVVLPVHVDEMMEAA